MERKGRFVEYNIPRDVNTTRGHANIDNLYAKPSNLRRHIDRIKN